MGRGTVSEILAAHPVRPHKIRLAGSQPAYRATRAGRPERPPQAEGLAEGLPHGLCGVPLFFIPIFARRAGIGTLVRMPQLKGNSIGFRPKYTRHR
jgi:hypothetical protein